MCGVCVCARVCVCVWCVGGSVGGSVGARDPRSITPTMLENTLPLLDTLIKGGVT